MNKNRKFTFEERIKVVQHHLKNGYSIRKTAEIFNIPYQTVHRWLKLYRNNGGEGLKNKKSYKKSWNRTPIHMEKKIVTLKEKNPALTIKQAQKLLKKDGDNVSIKGIWNIWKRYALTGRTKDDPYNFFGPWNSENKKKISEAKKYFREGNIRKAAEILNGMSSCPRDEILKKIPLNYLSDRRKYDKLFLIFGEIPFPTLHKEIKNIRKSFDRRNLKYSHMMATFLEVLCLHWMGNFRELEKLLQKLKPIVSKLKEPELKFIFYFHSGILAIVKCDEKTAYQMLSKCKKLHRYLTHPIYGRGISFFHNYMQKNKDSIEALKKLLLRYDTENTNIVLQRLSLLFAQRGKIKKSTQYLKTAKNKYPVANIFVYSSNAYRSFYKGNLINSLSHLEKALNFLKREQLIFYLSNIYTQMASIYTAMGNRNYGVELLLKNIYFSKNHGIEKQIIKCRLLLDKKSSLNSNIKKFKDLHVIHLIKKASTTKNPKFYYQALKVAKRNGIENIFYESLIFFPQIVTLLIKKGKKTYLPKSILRLPVFNRNIIVFDIKFLGNLRVYKSYTVPEHNNSREKDKNSKEKVYLRLKLTPKEKAFLIHLTLKIPEPGRFISLNKIYNNFWKYSQNPSRNLSHTLSKIRKQLKIPLHLLEISKKGNIPVLKNNGFYLLSDYIEFKETIARARALLRGNEWESAKKEFASAFRVLKGDPFRKMYDRWSEDTRLSIIFEIERNFIEFINECIKRNESNIARKTIIKALKIIKLSNELKELKQNL